MSTSNLLSAELTRTLNELLIAARKAQLSVTEATRKISEQLEDLGLDRGFVIVEELVITPGLQGARVVLQFLGGTEETITV
ncbi:hypothetical protein C4556_02170 [Candidatus Parcubacteria bacterium]|nr:MAG: hypothetical protein C4556_02170 [Candidatus Parcubacteria bacterium]